jgi:hypothetical protein
MDDSDVVKELGINEDPEELKDQLESLEYDLNDAYEEGKVVIQNQIQDLKNQIKEIGTIEDLREQLVEQITDRIEDELLDPVQYFIHDQGIFSNVGELLANNLVSVDYKKAAQEAVNVDGVAHFIASYDGNEMDLTDPETNETFVAYRTN